MLLILERKKKRIIFRRKYADILRLSQQDKQHASNKNIDESIKIVKT